MKLCISLLFAAWLCIIVLPGVYHRLASPFDPGTELAHVPRLDVQCADLGSPCPVWCADCTLRGVPRNGVWTWMVYGGVALALGTALYVGLVRLRWPGD